MILARSESCSEDSDDEVNEIDVHRRKYQLLLDRCEVLQQDNERIVNRIQKVRKLLRRTRKERRFIMNRLDQHLDNWRTASLPLELDEPIDPPLKGISSERTVPTTKLNKSSSSSTFEKGVSTPSAANSSKKSKVDSLSSQQQASPSPSPVPPKKSGKVASDPNAPKRPANPFFQYCQEQRTVLLESILSSGQKEPTKQELTKQLANKWNSLSTPDKKIYYDMYKKSKEKYTADMDIYTKSKGKL
ncbi:high mobility group protein B1-like isoform X2 [Nilaparvata lugens]|uniref:high mobility group protein B1-like isoform X2 n=1 Tax=Nilaparvata lugens TaxID=108931 RepID=UPI00193D04BD|nr:high mobility group protein B1-like isoform X2 [Nilaparvata lugens]XP_039290767.1 high mobility group protein B1-like isoform X2 [Nilaparvata lugens]